MTKAGGTRAFPGVGAPVRVPPVCPALLVGTVTVVAPTVASFPVFTLLVAAALRDERITGKVLAGVALVVIGVGVISGSAG